MTTLGWSCWCQVCVDHHEWCLPKQRSAEPDFTHLYCGNCLPRIQSMLFSEDRIHSIVRKWRHAIIWYRFLVSNVLMLCCYSVYMKISHRRFMIVFLDRFRFYHQKHFLTPRPFSTLSVPRLNAHRVADAPSWSFPPMWLPSRIMLSTDVDPKEVIWKK